MKTRLSFIGLFTLFSFVVSSVFISSAYAYRGNANINQTAVLNQVPFTEQEIEMLQYSYQEEMLARDVYEYFADMYDDNTFARIAQSEQQHMNAVLRLLPQSDVPESYGELTSLYEDLIEKGTQSLADAYNVGVDIEILDITDIQDLMKKTDNASIQMMWNRIGGASYNHLRAFVRQLEKNDYVIESDYSDYISSTEKNMQRRGGRR